MESGMPPTNGGTTPEGSATSQSGTNLGGTTSPPAGTSMGSTTSPSAGTSMESTTSPGAGMSMESSLPAAGDVTQDDKLWALLAYVLSPIFPVIIMAMPEKKERPFLKAHNAQALVLGVIQVVLAILSVPLLCIPGLLSLGLFLVQIYWGIQAYNGNHVTIPVITDFVRQQGWA